mgnify:CR=1 FL=1
MENNPLVSVIVVTYNSSEFICEALDSVYRQTYDNLELIVSDDCSSDDTIIKVKSWIEKYGKRFSKSTVIESATNTGTSANNNRAIKACEGMLIRWVAGDDLIPEKAIEQQVGYLLEKPECYLLNGFSKTFKVENAVKVFTPNKKIIDIEPGFYDMSAGEQYKYMLTHDKFGLTEGTMVRR